MYISEKGDRCDYLCSDVDKSSGCKSARRSGGQTRTRTLLQVEYSFKRL